MNVTIAAWNAKAGFDNERMGEACFERIAALDADVVVISEAYSVDREFTAGDMFAYEGYRYMAVDRDEQDPRTNRMVVMMSRLNHWAEPVRLGNRNGVSMYFPVLDIEVVGIHLEDRDKAERLRSVVDFVSKADNMSPAVLAGDLNDMHRGDAPSKIFGTKLAKAGANLLPTRMKDIARRLHNMAAGESLAYLRSVGYEDADPEHRITFQPFGIPTAQLDHIMYDEEHFAIKEFTLGERGVSDHKPITATLEIS